ncbi:MAG TPA: hypothetical protein VEA69_10835 [Tepidisphaeraceae bacterium]|nr:hypothetical protein [Tepidisphaeraceae bacterium]
MTEPTTARRPRLHIILALVAILPAAGHAVYFHLSTPALPYDDAHIAYRYVDNALAGRGLVYNEGERVFGCTAPLHLAWVAAWKTALPWVDTPALAVRANVVPFLVTAAAIFVLARRTLGGLLWPTALATCFLLQQQMLRISGGGMEPFLFTALAGFAFVSMADRRPVATGLLLALAILTRPEGVVLVPLAAVAFARAPRKLLAAATACLIPVGAWVVFAWAYFGTPIPHSVVAKARPVFTFEPGHAYEVVVVCFRQWMTGAGIIPFALDNPLTKALGVADVYRRHAPAVVVGALTVLAVCVPRLRRAGAYAPGAAFCLLLVLYGRGNPFMFEWYMPLLYVTALLGVALPLIGLMAWARRWMARSTTSPVLQRGCVLAAQLAGLIWLGFAAFADGMITGRTWAAYAAIDGGERVRILAYRTVAERLNAHIRPGDRVAAPEIGALGYYLRGRILDAVGLVSPEATPYHPVPTTQRSGPGSGMIPGDLIDARQPEWIVTMPTFAARSLFWRSTFESNYARWDAVALPEPIWGSGEIVIYRRRW